MAGQSAAGVMDALFVACQQLYADAGALVTFGQPGGEYLPDLIVAIMECRTPVTRPTQGPARSREKAAEVDIVFSVFVPGGPEAAQPANTAAWAAADQLETWLRTDPNQRLGGACRDSWVSTCVATPDIGWDHVDGIDAPIPAGRVVAVTATVRADIRY